MAQRPWMGMAAGALGGLIGSGMMVAFQHLLGGSNDREDGAPHHRTQATPNETDGTFPDVPASVKTAELLSEKIAGHEPTEQQKRIGGSILHYAFGAATGGIYGAIAAMQPRAAAGAGLPFGAAVWLLAAEIGVPASGLAEPPTEYPLRRHAASLGSHLVFGLTVESVRRALACRH